MEDHSKVHNKPSTQKSYQYQIDTFIVPAFGIKKAHEVIRHDITALMKRMKRSPLQANRILSCLRKMFNLAELWGYRPDDSNPCRHVPKYPEKGSTHLITDDQIVKLFASLDKADTMLNKPMAIPNSTKPTCIVLGSNGNGAGTAMIYRWLTR